MSIMNVWLERSHALVGVDTAAKSLEGQTGQMSKLVPLVHLNAVIAFRGCALFAAGVFATLLALGPKTADVLFECLPQIFPHALDQVRRAVQSGGLAAGGAAEMQEIALVAWSGASSCMKGRVWTKRTAEGEFVQTDIGKEYICVWDPSLESYPEPSSAARMANLARAQCRLIWEKEPEVAAGGEFIVAQLSRSGLAIGPRFDLGAS